MWGYFIDLPKISSVCTGAEICAHPDRCFDAVGNEHRHLVCGFGSFDRNAEDWVGVSDHRAAGHVVWTVYSSDCSRSRRHHQVSAQAGRRVFLWLYPDGDVGRNGVWMFLVPGKMHHLSCDCIQELNFVVTQLLLEHLLDFPFVWNAVFGCIGSKGD